MNSRLGVNGISCIGDAPCDLGEAFLVPRVADRRPLVLGLALARPEVRPAPPVRPARAHEVETRGEQPPGPALRGVLDVGRGERRVGRWRETRARPRASRSACGSRAAGRSGGPGTSGMTWNCHTSSPVARSASRVAAWIWFRWSFSPVMLTMSRPLRTKRIRARAPSRSPGHLDHVVDVVSVQAIGAREHDVVAATPSSSSCASRVGGSRRALDRLLGNELEEARVDGEGVPPPTASSPGVS